jgi:hypothetical protein
MESIAAPPLGAGMSHPQVQHGLPLDFMLLALEFLYIRFGLESGD